MFIHSNTKCQELKRMPFQIQPIFQMLSIFISSSWRPDFNGSAFAEAISIFNRLCLLLCLLGQLVLNFNVQSTLVKVISIIKGRLEDLISTGQLSLKQCRFFILDEADGLLKGGYEPLINRLHAQIPKMTSDGTRLQVFNIFERRFYKKIHIF